RAWSTGRLPRATVRTGQRHKVRRAGAVRGAGPDEVRLGYLRLGQPATELHCARRGHALYLLDEPTAGLHPSDVALLLRQLHRLVDAGNTVALVEHDLDTIATADWVIDLGPGDGDAGGRVVAGGPPAKVARARRSATAPYLAARLAHS
ncbi:hypothetical protein ACFW9X_12800, partial [Streptomyces sp. NPDC059466]